MIRFLYGAMLLTLSVRVSSQPVNAITPDQSVATLGRVWGLLKYYHPHVARGRADWDQVFLSTLPRAEQIRDRDALAQLLSGLINQLGHQDSCRTCSATDTTAFQQVPDFAWLDDAALIAPALRRQLRFVVANRNQSSNQYVYWNPLRNRLVFNEKEYGQMALPDAAYRLLGLARYWNVIAYFHPARAQFDRYWNNVLNEFIPKFRRATDTLSYQLVLRQLIGSIQDGHAVLLIPDAYQLHSKTPVLYPPFYGQVVQDTLLVTGYFNDSLSQLSDVRVGDRILSIAGKSITQQIEERSSYTTASNPPAQLAQVSPFLLTGSTPFVTLRTVRRGQVLEKQVNRYPFPIFGYRPSVGAPKAVPPTIGYVDMGQLTVKEVKQVMDRYRSRRGIIFDVRTYPRGTFQRLGDYLNAHSVGFARYAMPDLTLPGAFKLGPLQRTGRENPGYYRGKVAILCNTLTQSAAESTCLALRTAPNARTFGSQSAGANGDVCYITFPGNYQTRFTGTGVYTPDGKPVQQNGVPIDVVVRPTGDDVLSGTDKALQTAIDWIN